MNNMEPGEKELRKVFEETTTRNVTAAIGHGNETRRLVRELENKIKVLEGTIDQYKEKLEFLQKQITGLQQRAYINGS